ncbi:hypothetical protein Tco_0361360 [Tanacetum coccineum]
MATVRRCGTISAARGSGSRLDTVYWGFFGVGVTLDIFQNIILIPYLEYGVLSPLDAGVLIFIPLLVFGECRHGYAVSSLMDTAYWSLE